MAKRLLMGFRGRVARIMATLQSWDIEFLELQTGLASLNWGLWMIAPWNHPYRVSPSLWRVLSAIAPAHCWGVLIAAAGLVQLVALWAHVHYLDLDHLRLWRTAFHIRHHTSFLIVLMWIFLVSSFFISDNRAPSIPVYVVLVFSAALTYIRLSFTKPTSIEARARLSSLEQVSAKAQTLAADRPPSYEEQVSTRSVSEGTP